MSAADGKAILTADGKRAVMANGKVAIDEACCPCTPPSPPVCCKCGDCCYSTDCFVRFAYNLILTPMAGGPPITKIGTVDTGTPYYAVDGLVFGGYAVKDCSNSSLWPTWQFDLGDGVLIQNYNASFGNCRGFTDVDNSRDSTGQYYVSGTVTGTVMGNRCCKVPCVSCGDCCYHLGAVMTATADITEDINAWADACGNLSDPTIAALMAYYGHGPVSINGTFDGTQFGRIMPYCGSIPRRDWSVDVPNAWYNNMGTTLPQPWWVGSIYGPCANGSITIPIVLFSMNMPAAWAACTDDACVNRSAGMPQGVLQVRGSLTFTLVGNDNAGKCQPGIPADDGSCDPTPGL